MAWFKVDDKLHSHPKRYRASLRAMGLWVLAGSWCSDQLTDGVIPRDLLAALRAELTTPVPEWHGGTDPDSVTERRREALRGRPTDGGLMREPTRGDGTMGAQQKTAPVTSRGLTAKTVEES